MSPVKNPDSINFEIMSLTDLDYPEEYFDYVFCISSIEHVNAGKFAIKGMAFDEGDDIALKELYRVTKLNGICVITTDIAEKYIPPPGLWKSA